MEMNHMIVWCEDQQKSAEFLAWILDTQTTLFGHFDVVTIGGFSLDFANHPQPGRREHIAILISEDEFDKVYAKIKSHNIQHWADPLRKKPGEINHDDGGRGVYFTGPDDHNWEVMTRPYDRESLKRNPIPPPPRH